MAQKEAIMRALMEAMGSSAPMTSKRPMARPKMIGASPSGGTRGIDPKDNYSPEDLKKLLRGYKKVRGYNKGGRVEKILRGLGEGSDMSVAALLRMIEGAGGGMGSGAAMAGRKAAGMNPRGAGTTRSGRQLNRMGVSEDIIEMLEGTRPGRKAPLQALGFKKGGAVRKKKPKMGCVMKGRGGKYKGQK